MNKPKFRASVLEISGQKKYEILKAVISHYNFAFEHSFFLEATALIESLITDRLESRIAELTKEQVKFNTLNNLLIKLNELENNEVLKKIMNKQIHPWASQRNITIHQAAKIEVGKKKDWGEFIRLAKTTAKDGRKAFDDYNKQLVKLRREKSKKII